MALELSVNEFDDLIFCKVLTVKDFFRFYGRFFFFGISAFLPCVRASTRSAACNLDTCDTESKEPKE
jgi:hypothetical protein